jgi:phosphonoacetaldehyde hydrolase
MTDRARIRLVVFDWAGTTVDYGCFAPVSAFQQVFARRDVPVTTAEARAPMGLHKRDHIRAMFAMPEVAARWRKVADRDWTEADVDALYHDFTPLQVVEAQKFTALVPGVLECVKQLRAHDIRIASTTGYPREVAQPVIDAAARQGYRPDCNICADEVPAGRPEPWMIYRAMEQLRIFPAEQVVNVGDTVPDVESGVNAGVWSVGVAESSSEVGCTPDEFASLAPREQQARINAARKKLESSGAHEVLRSLADLPDLIVELETRLEDGERPRAESLDL